MRRETPAGIPYFLHVEIDVNEVVIELLRLSHSTEPLQRSFDPAELLEP